MKVILLEDIAKKGKKEDVIEVSAGYGMHLVREKKAVEFSKGSVKVLETKQKAKDDLEKELHDKAIANKKILEKKEIIFQLMVGENDKPFKSISPKQIVEKVMKDYNIKIDKRKFLNHNSINVLGITNVDVELTKNVVATLKIWIKKQ